MKRTQLTHEQVKARREAFEWGIANNASWQAMADRIGMNDETYRKYAQTQWPDEFRERLKARMPKAVSAPALTPEEVERRLAGYRRAVAEHLTLTEIARELGISNSALGRWFAGQGLSLKWDVLQELDFEPPKQMKPRRCLCCNAAFVSEGFGNRLCQSCRGASVSPYSPASDGDSGRRVRALR